MQMAEISVHKSNMHRVKSKYQLMLMHEKPAVQDIKSITEEKIEEGNVSIEDTWLSCDKSKHMIIMWS